jgi:hypothetical protein
MVEASGLVELRIRDAPLANRNARSTQMLCDGRPMQVPPLGEPLHAVPSLILGNEPIDLPRRESALRLSLPGRLLARPSPEQCR